ncbi:MAG: domain containing CoxE-like protein [Acidimicrobiaceae bacterium]|nr:domain containing CoxE-like protein [Acidimicrobiaceae bacterium]
MLGTLTAFAEELRRTGLPVSLTETLDAARALGHLGIDERDQMRAGLAATLVKDADHLPAFETVFDLWFADLGVPGGVQAELSEFGTGDEEQPSGEGNGDAQAGGGEAGGFDGEPVSGLVSEALRSGDPARLAALARLGIARFAAIEAGRPVGVSYDLDRVLRGLGLDDVLAELLDQVAAGEELGTLGSGAVADPALRRRLAAEHLRGSAQALRAEVETEIARLLAAERGPEAVARGMRRSLVEDVDFMHASREELAALRRSLRPLARALAARLARRRRRQRRGALDFRATIRRSLSAGGVPIEPRFRSPRRAKPELIVIADVSGSVAAFARFTLHLVHAIASQFSAVRTFVFVDGIDEVTRIFATSSGIAEAIERVQREADVAAADGHSDYGAALRRFTERYLSAVTSRSTVLILGDGRGNYHPPQPEALAEIARRARHLFWLNPEPRAYWGSGDSVVDQYAGCCDAMVECRNLRQLEAFVDALA